MVVGADLCLLSSDDFDENRISENDEREVFLSILTSTCVHTKKKTQRKKKKRKKNYTLCT